MQGEVGTVGEGGVVDPLRGQARPDDVAVLGFGKHVGRATNRTEDVVTGIRQGRGPHEARVGSHGQGRRGQGAQHRGARGGQGVVLDRQPVRRAGGGVLLGQAHIQVASRDFNRISEEGRGGRRVGSSAIIGTGRRVGCGRRVWGGLLRGGSAGTHAKRGGQTHVLADRDVGGLGNRHDGVGQRVGTDRDAHVHGLTLAHPQVLRLRVHASRTQRPLHGAPGAEVILGLEELDLVGRPQARVGGSHGRGVLVGRARFEIVGDINAARRQRQAVGIPHGSGIGVGGAEELLARSHRDRFLVPLRVLGGLGDPSGRGGILGNVDRLDRGGIGPEQFGDSGTARLDRYLGEEVAVDGDPRATGVGGHARVDGDVGEMVVARMLSLRVRSERQRGNGRLAVPALGACGVVGAHDVLDGALGGVGASNLPDERGEGRGVDRLPVGATRRHLVGRNVAARLRKRGVEMRMARVVHAAVAGIVAREETIDAVSVVDEHLHASRAIDAHEVKSVGVAFKLVGVTDLTSSQARPDGRVSGSGILRRGVEDASLRSEEGQVRATGGDDELRLRLVLLPRSGPCLGEPQDRLFHREVDGVEREARGVVVPDGDGRVDVLSGDDPVLVLVGSGPRRTGSQCQEQGERCGAHASQV